MFNILRISKFLSVKIPSPVRTDLSFEARSVILASRFEYSKGSINEDCESGGSSDNQMIDSNVCVQRSPIGSMGNRSRKLAPQISTNPVSLKSARDINTHSFLVIGMLFSM